MSSSRAVLPFALALAACASHASSAMPPRRKPWPSSCKNVPAGPTVPVEPTVAAEPVGDVPTGDLPKDVIRKVIRTRLCDISRCYQAELAQHPDLAGRITAVFRIASDGHVYHVDASGLGNAAVESCVAGVIRSLRFPAPAGDGFVRVSYPFTFKSGD
jgi:hypothetical protein